MKRGGREREGEGEREREGGRGGRAEMVPLYRAEKCR